MTTASPLISNHAGLPSRRLGYEGMRGQSGIQPDTEARKAVCVIVLKVELLG